MMALANPSDLAKARPLYPATRVLRRSLIESEQILDRCRERRDSFEAELLERRREAQEEVHRRFEIAAAEVAEIREKARSEAAADARQEFDRLLHSVQEKLDAIEKALPKRLVEVALDLARAVLRSELATRDELLLGLVQDTLRGAKREQEIRLHLAPQDLARIGADLRNALPTDRRVQLIADPELQPFSVRLETECGIHDGSLDQRIRALGAHLASRLERSTHD